MSRVVVPERLLETRGHSARLDAFVVACAFDRTGETAAFALGDGTLRLSSLAGEDVWPTVPVHEGATLSLSADVTDGFLTGGDDGRLARVSTGGTVSVLAEYGMKWVEHVTSFSDAKRGLLACGVGKQVHVFDGAGDPLKSLAHPSTVTGIAFDARGKRIAASHYGGASLWFVASKSDNPRRTRVEGQPYRHRDQPGWRLRGDGDAGELTAWVAPFGRAAHAHVGLSNQDHVDELFA